MPRSTNVLVTTVGKAMPRPADSTNRMLVVMQRAARQSEPIKVHDEAARIATRFAEADPRTPAQDLKLLAERRNIRCEA